MRAATYARKSNLDARRPGKSVADQQREARAVVEARGWTLVKELFDDGISASRHARRKERPGFDELLDLIDRGEIDAVVMAEQSRATRSLSVLGALLESCAERNVMLVVGGTDVDPSKPEGFLLAGVTGAVDASESERARSRTLRGVRGAAAAGRPAGRNLYGYRREYHPDTRALLRVVPIPEQVAIVREVVTRILAGESVRAITNDLIDRGVPTPTGNGRWHPVTVRRLALNPGYAARRVHRGKVVGPASWPAIVTDAEHEAVTAVLTEPSRSQRRLGAQRHLLSGTARCGECGGPLRALLDRRRPTYTCFTHGCFKVGVGRAHLDEYVTEAVLARLSSPDTAAALAGADCEQYQTRVAEVAVLQARQADIGAAIASGALSLAAGTAADAAISEQITAAERAASAALPNPALAAIAGPDARTAWQRLTVEQRVEIVRLLAEIVVNRSTRPRGTHGFDQDRVVIRWR